MTSAPLLRSLLIPDPEGVSSQTQIYGTHTKADRNFLPDNHYTTHRHNPMQWRSSESRISSDGDEVTLENGASTNGKSLYGTAPRSKAKDLSYSELDLRKSKKFSTFSFGLRKKKRDDLSKSTIGLHGPGAHEHRKHLDLSQWELDQVQQRGAFAMSQPELDTADTFDIPPPPSVSSQLTASHRSASEAFLSDPPPTLHDRHGRLRSLETLLDTPDAFDVDREVGEAPIATIPELLLTAPPTPDLSQGRVDPGTQENRARYPIPDRMEGKGPSGTMPRGGAFFSGNRTSVDSPLPSSRPADAVLSPLVFINKLKRNSDAPVPRTPSDLPDCGRSTDKGVHAAPTLPVTAGAEMDAAATIKTLLDLSRLNPVDASSPLLPQDPGVSHFREAVPSDRGTPPADRTPVSGETFESVFSQSFTTEVFSAMPKPYEPPASDPVTGAEDLRHQHGLDSLLPVHANAGFPGSPMEPPGVSEHGPCAIEVAPDVLVSAWRPDTDTHNGDGDGDGDKTPTNHDPRMDTEDGRRVLDSLYDSLLPLSLRQTGPTLPNPGQRPESPGALLHADPEPTGSHGGGGRSLARPERESGFYSALKPEHFGPIENTVPPVSPAPPNPPHNYGSFPETEDTLTQVSLVPKAAGSVTLGDDLSTSPAPLPPLETMAASIYQRETLEAMAAEEKEEEEEDETFSEPKGQLDSSTSEPIYISVGSDASSNLDVYFSADEDTPADEDTHADSDLDNVSTLAGSEDLHTETEDLYDLAMRDHRFRVPGFSDIGRTVPDGGRETAAFSGGEGREGVLPGDQIDEEGRRLRTIVEDQQQMTRREESPPAAASPLVYSPPSPPPPPPPEGEQQQEERGVTEGTESLRSKTHMWGQRLDKHEEEEEEEELPALPVQQVERVVECEPAPPFSHACNREEVEVGGRNWKPLISPIAEEQPNIPWSQVPDLPGTQHLSHKRDTETRTQTHLGRDTHTQPNVSAVTSVRRAGEEEGEAASVAVKADGGNDERSERSPAHNVSAAKSPVIVARYTPDTTTTITSTTTSITATTTSITATTTSFFFVGGEPSDGAAPSGVVLQQQTTNEANDASGLEASPAIRRPSVQPQGSQTTDLHLSATTSGSPHRADPHHLQPGPPPPPPPPPVAAAMSSAYSSSLYVTRRGSPSGGDGDGDSHRRYAHEETSTSSTPSPSRPPEEASENRWRNTFSGVSQYKPDASSTISTTSSTSFPDSSVSSALSSSSSSSSSRPEATLYTRYLPPSPATPQPLETYGSRDDGLSDSRREVYVSSTSVSAAPEEGGAGAGGRRSWEWEEPTEAPARRSQEAWTEEIKPRHDTAHLAVDSNKRQEEDHVFTGVFKATRVDLITSPTTNTPEVVSPYHDMEVLKDTLKSLGPSQKQRSLRGAPFGFSSLEPIVEDTQSSAGAAGAPAVSSPFSFSSSSFDVTDSSSSPPSVFGLPPDLGFSSKLRRSPMDMMKSQQDQQQGTENGSWGLGRPLRGSASNSIVLRSSPDDAPLSPSTQNGNGLPPFPASGSRLDHSVLFSSYRSPSVDAPPDSPLASRSLFRTSSLPDSGLSSYDRISKAPRGVGGGDAPSSTYDRFSFLLNSGTSSSPSGSLTGTEDLYARISRGPQGAPAQRNIGSTGSLDLQRTSFTTAASDTPFSAYGQAHGGGMGPGAGVLGAPLLQRSFSSDAPEPPAEHDRAMVERAMAAKYRAFPDAYVTQVCRPGVLTHTQRVGTALSGGRTDLRGRGWTTDRCSLRNALVLHDTLGWGDIDIDEGRDLRPACGFYGFILDNQEGEAGFKAPVPIFVLSSRGWAVSRLPTPIPAICL
ncbi:hypothetical protein NHX12_023482, partial [Muraenolepis orangiensis]